MVCPCLSVTSCSDTPARKQNSLNCACCFHRRWSFGIQVHEKFASHSIWPYTSFLVSDKLDSTDPRHQNITNLTFAQHLFRSIHKDYTPWTCQTQLNPYPNTIGHAALIRHAAYYEPDTVDDRDITSAMHPSPSFMTDP